MGRTQSAFSVIATVLQVGMSYHAWMVRGARHAFHRFSVARRDLRRRSRGGAARARAFARRGENDLRRRFSGTGFSLWDLFLLAQEKPHRLKHVLLNCNEERLDESIHRGGFRSAGPAARAAIRGARPFGDRASAQRESRKRRERSGRRAAPRGFVRCGIPGPGGGRLRHRHSRGHGDSRKAKDDSRRLGDERPHSPQRHALPHRSRRQNRRENLHSTKRRLGGAPEGRIGIR